MPVEVDHIAVAVQSIEKSLPLYRDLLGLWHRHTEEVQEQRVRAALLAAGETRIELLEPTADDSPVARHLAVRGEGLHHIAFQVPDLEASLLRLKEAGVRLIDETPRSGVSGTRIAFIHPKAASGVLIELVEKR